MAVEDIGLAEPNALALCMAARDAVDFIGMPEGVSAGDRYKNWDR